MKYRLLLAFLVLVLVSFVAVLTLGSPPPSPLATVADTTENTNSLRSLAEKRGIAIGAAVAFKPLQNDPTYAKVLAREFNLLVPENEMKFSQVHPERDRYDFSKSDTLVEFAKTNHLKVRGHPLVWHYALPSWLDDGNFTRDELLTILKTHVQTLVSRYREQTVAWDVVNEALNRDGSFRDTLWLRHIGPEYLDLAFRWAHEADPDARLFYSDYGGEELGQKSDAIYKLVEGMLQRGVPIHGVGMQMHKGLSYVPELEPLTENIKRIGELGLEVQFTELDVQIADGRGSREERLETQADIYKGLLDVCLSLKNCTAFITWGFTDRHSWVGNLTGQVEAPLLFDANYRPKPAYEALVESLETETQE